MNDDFDRYLEKYGTKHKITKEEAEKHVIVQEVKAQYEKKDNSTKTVGWKEV